MDDKQILERIERQGTAGKVVDVWLESPPRLRAAFVFGGHVVEVTVDEVLHTFTVNEYAARKGIHRNTVLRWIGSGRLRAYKGTSGGKSVWLIPGNGGVSNG